jgi:hypothetical protein
MVDFGCGFNRSGRIFRMCLAAAVVGSACSCDCDDFLKMNRRSVSASRVREEQRDNLGCGRRPDFLEFAVFLCLRDFGIVIFYCNSWCRIHRKTAIDQLSEVFPLIGLVGQDADEQHVGF